MASIVDWTDSAVKNDSVQTAALVVGSIVAEELIEVSLVALGGPALGAAFMYFGLASLFVDLTDPYGFSSVLSRDAVNTGVAGIQTTFADTFNPESVQVELKARLVDTYGDLYSDATLDKFVSKMTQIHSVYELTPPGVCYGNAGEEVPSYSGVPTTDCDVTYRTAYDNYVTENAEQYAADAITDNRLLVGLINNLALGGIRADYRAKTREYTAYLIIVAVVVGLSFIPLFL